MDVKPSSARCPGRAHPRPAFDEKRRHSRDGGCVACMYLAHAHARRPANFSSSLRTLAHTLCYLSRFHTLPLSIFRGNPSADAHRRDRRELKSKLASATSPPALTSPATAPHTNTLFYPRTAKRLAPTTAVFIPSPLDGERNVASSWRYCQCSIISRIKRPIACEAVQTSGEHSSQ